MSARPPSIATVRDLAKAHGAKKLIVFCHLPNGQYGYTSYGWSKAECARAKAAGDRLYPVFMNALIEEGDDD